MSTPTKRKKRRGRVRYDRIAIAFAILAVLIAVVIWLLSAIVSGIAGLFSDGADKNSSTSSATTSSKNDTLSPTFSTTEYTQVFRSYNDIHNGFLIVVNNENEYIFPKDETLMTPLSEAKTEHYKVKDDSIMLNTNVIKAFNSMMGGFYALHTNNNIMVVSAYHTAEYQNILYNQALDNNIIIPKGGFSDHHTGYAADLNIAPQGEIPTSYTADGVYSWINENCDKYGFTLRYPDDKADITGNKGESSHFRYVGIPHAYYMKTHNLCLEEYISEIKNYAFGTNSLKISCYSKNYEVYYIKAKTEGNTEVFVPNNNNYTLSGNNIDGFIVTCEVK